MIKIETIINEFLELGLELVENVENTSYYFDNRANIVVLVIVPHEGNNYNWIIRADTKDGFDRWSNCIFESEFKTEKELDSIIDEFCLYFIDKN